MNMWQWIRRQAKPVVEAVTTALRGKKHDPAPPYGKAFGSLGEAVRHRGCESWQTGDKATPADSRSFGDFARGRDDGGFR